MRQKAIDDSLDMIRSKSSIEQNRCVFEDLSTLKKNFMKQEFGNYLDRGSQHSQASLSSSMENLMEEDRDISNILDSLKITQCRIEHLSKKSLNNT